MMRTYERPTLTAAGSFRITGIVVKGPRDLLDHGNIL